MKNKTFLLVFLFLFLIAPYKAFSQNTDGSSATLQETLDWLNSKFSSCVTKLDLYHPVWHCNHAAEKGEVCEKQTITLRVYYYITLSNTSLIINCTSVLYGEDPLCMVDDDDATKSICETEWNDFETQSKFIESREIPFSKIKRIDGWTDGTTAWANGFSSTQLMLRVTTYGNDIIMKDGSLTNTAFIPFNWNAEQNLDMRMNKAFIHLHQFYPPTVEKF